MLKFNEASQYGLFNLGDKVALVQIEPSRHYSLTELQKVGDQLKVKAPFKRTNLAKLAEKIGITKEQVKEQVTSFQSDIAALKELEHNFDNSVGDYAKAKKEPLSKKHFEKFKRVRKNYQTFVKIFS